MIAIKIDQTIYLAYKVLANCQQWNYQVLFYHDIFEFLISLLFLGFLIRKKGNDDQQTTIMGSMTLFPTKYPKSMYNKALAVQSAYNELYHKVANDYDFLKEALMG